MPSPYICHHCNIVCKSNYDLERHRQTNKHKSAEFNNKYTCACGKSYKQRFSLCRHKKTCSVTIQTDLVAYSTDGNKSNSYPQLTPEFIIELVHQNQELKTLLLEERESRKEDKEEIKSMFEKIHKRPTTVISGNTFNLNFFLNEQCKDAIPIMEFIDSLQVNTNNVEYTGRRGYVEGITKIFMDGLRQLDIYKRPIHCTDLKRETLYIKDTLKWEKDNPEKSLFHKALRGVVLKNMKQIRRWQEENPNCIIPDSKEYVLHLDIMRQSIGGGMMIEEKNNGRILKNIAKEVFLDRKLTTSLLFK